VGATSKGFLLTPVHLFIDTATDHKQILLLSEMQDFFLCGNSYTADTWQRERNPCERSSLPFTNLPLPYSASLILTPLPSSFAEGIERLSKCKQNRQALKDVKCLTGAFQFLCLIPYLLFMKSLVALLLTFSRKTEYTFRFCLSYGLVI
jgi:hypothetical protein